MFKFFQNLGRSLMLPVAVLPAAAIIVGIGNALNALHALPQVAQFFVAVGTTILEQLGILFAIGVAIGMAKKLLAERIAVTNGFNYLLLLVCLLLYRRCTVTLKRL